MSYDQWKTASPYDDEPDMVEEAYKFLKVFKGRAERREADEHFSDAYYIIKSLVEILEEEGVI